MTAPLSSAIFITALSLSFSVIGGSELRYLALGQIALSLLLAYLLFNRAKQYRQQIISLPVILIIAFVTWVTLSVLWAQNPSAAIVRFSIFWSLPIMVLISILWNAREIRFTQTILLIFGVYAGLLTLYQAIFTPDIGPVGLLLNRNNNAALFNLLLFPVIALFITSQRKIQLATALCLLLFSIVIGLSGSRGVLLALLIGVGVFIWLAYGLTLHRHRIHQALLICFTGVLIGSLIAPTSGIERITSESAHLRDLNLGNSGRLQIWHATWDMYTDHPILGTGIGNFFLMYPRYKLPLESSSGQHVHNDYFEFLVELGPVGPMLIVALMGILFLYALRFYRQRRAEQTNTLIFSGYFAALTAVAAHSMVTFNLYHYPFLIIIGMYVGQIIVLATQPISNNAFTFPEKLSPFSKYALLFIALYIPVYWYGSLGAYDYLVTKSRNQDTLLDSIELAEKAGHLFPYQDVTNIQIASSLNGFIASKRRMDSDARLLLLENALEQLHIGRRYTPDRWESYFIEGSLLIKMGADFHLIDHAFSRALTINPEYLKARVAYARWLLQIGDQENATKILLEGWGRYYFAAHADIVDYINMISNAIKDSDNVFLRNAIHQKHKEIINANKDNLPPMYGVVMSNQ